MFKPIMLIAALACVFSACDLLNSEPDKEIEKKIDDKVNFAKAPRLTVAVDMPGDWGSSNPPQGTITTIDIRQGFPFVVEFSPSTAYGFKEWRAYRTADYAAGKTGDEFSLEETAAVSISAGKAGGRAEITINSTEPVTLVPYCVERPAVLGSNLPGVGKSTFINYSVLIQFSQAMMEADLINALADGAITITGKPASAPASEAAVSLKDKFTYDGLSEGGTLLKLKVANDPNLADYAITLTLSAGIRSAEGIAMAGNTVLRYNMSADMDIVGPKVEGLYYVNGTAFQQDETSIKMTFTTDNPTVWLLFDATDDKSDVQSFKVIEKRVSPGDTGWSYETESFPARYNGSAAGVTSAAWATKAGKPNVIPYAIKYSLHSLGEVTLTVQASDGIQWSVDADAKSVSSRVYIEKAFVTESGTGDKSGRNWANASDDLQLMMDNANGYNTGTRTTPSDPATGTPGMVYAAAGTYTPKHWINSTGITTDTKPLSTWTERDKTFMLRPGVKVYGGYLGGETDLTEETHNSFFNDDGTPKEGHTSRLSGGSFTVTGSGADLSITGNSDNLYHVVIAYTLTADDLLDGFTISGGNANADSSISIGEITTLYRSYGGGIHIQHTATPRTKPTLTNITLSGNNATQGGGLYSNYADLDLDRVVIKDNTATGTNAYGGGAYFGNGLNITLRAATISGNTAAGSSYARGGGVYFNICNSVTTQSEANITGNTAIGTTTAYGGGIYFMGNSGSNTANFTMEGGTISGNKAMGASYNYGGGVYFEGHERYSTFSMSGGTIGGTASGAGNTATGSGGGVYIYSGNFEMKGTAKLSGNTSGSYGGGVCFQVSSRSVSGISLKAYSVVSGNTAQYGGGVYSDMSFSMDGSAKISGNTAVPSSMGSGGYGGGVYVAGTYQSYLYGEATIGGSAAEGNTAKRGGGIYLDTTSVNAFLVLSSGSSISYNKATEANGGGGVYVAGSAGVNNNPDRVSNNTANDVANNIAP